MPLPRILESIPLREAKHKVWSELSLTATTFLRQLEVLFTNWCGDDPRISEYFETSNWFADTTTSIISDYFSLRVSLDFGTNLLSLQLIWDEPCAEWAWSTRIMRDTGNQRSCRYRRNTGLQDHIVGAEFLQ